MQTKTPLLLLVLLAGCPGPTGTGEVDGTGGTDGAAEFDWVYINPDGSPPVLVNRYIRYLEDGGDDEGACDSLLTTLASVIEGRGGAELSGWSARPLFGVTDVDDWTSAVRQPVPIDEIPVPLRYYCVVDGPVPSADVELYEEFATEALRGEYGIYPDRMVLSGASLPDDLGPWLDAELIENTHRHNRSTCPGDDAVTTRLVLFDTAPTGSFRTMEAPSGDGSEHGWVLGHLAKRLLCDESTSENCVATVQSRQAMPFLASSNSFDWALKADNTLAHGNFGTLSWLAQALRRETVANLGTTDRLVYNLSLAFHPTSAGLDMSDANWAEADLDRTGLPETSAVYDAMRDAQCNGALVLAAVGNATPYDSSDDPPGPLLPAAWAGVPLGNAPTCDTLGTTGAASIGSTEIAAREDQTPVYPVGAINGTGQELAVSRPRSIPPLLAYGLAGTAQVRTGGFGTPMTGTSTATVVASAAMAAEWAQVSAGTTVEAADIAAGIQTSGDSLASTVGSSSVIDFFTDINGTDGTPRKVTLCSVQGGACCLQASNSIPSPTLTSVSTLSSLAPTSAPATPSAPSGYVLPQPNHDGCPPCGIRGGLTGSFIGSPSTTLNNTTLTVTTDAPTLTTTTFDLGTLSAGVDIEIPLTGLTGNVESAELQFQGEVLDESQAWNSDLFVLPPEGEL